MLVFGEIINFRLCLSGYESSSIMETRMTINSRWIGCAAAITVMLIFSSASNAQDYYGRQDLLALLARGDISKIPEDQANYFAVNVTIVAIGYSNCDLREPKRSLYRPYLSEIFRRFMRKAKTDTPLADMAALGHPRYAESIALLLARGCDSAEIQSIIEHSLRFGLGHDPTDFSGAMPLIESKSDVYDMQISLADRYCKYEGRTDPACANFLGFIEGRVEPFCLDGMVIPAAPEPPQVVSCWYAPLTDQNMGVKYKFWYERTPGNLDAHWVHGEYQFSEIDLLAVAKCPETSVEADRLSQQRPDITEASSVHVSYAYPESGAPDPCNLVIEETPNNQEASSSDRGQSRRGRRVDE